MMYFAYHIYPYIDYQLKKQWTPLVNTTLSKRKLLILGYGNNGISLAKKAKAAFDMKINAVKRRISDNFIGKEYNATISTNKYQSPQNFCSFDDLTYATAYSGFGRFSLSFLNYNFNTEKKIIRKISQYSFIQN